LAKTCKLKVTWNIFLKQLINAGLQQSSGLYKIMSFDSTVRGYIYSDDERVLESDKDFFMVVGYIK